MTVKIVQNKNPVLRGKAHAVSKSDVGGKKLASIVADMKKALATQKDGVALAAPQIDIPLQIFIVAGAIFKKETDEKTPDDMVFINPAIVKKSRTKKWLEEGCLSVRWKYGEVHRHTKATVRALGLDGKPFEVGASGLLAQIFQHETDHLNGVLFIDTARNVHDMPPEKPEKPEKK
ncbi:MAG: peptide deformylase [Candidatus Campbellbacteria bacterium]|nr:peptide deformylase [Candidatus Campbellbacteria bacterium]